jgi:hypothetical protein
MVEVVAQVVVLVRILGQELVALELLVKVLQVEIIVVVWFLVLAVEVALVPLV